MEYTSFSPQTNGSPWQDLFTCDSSDAASISSSRRPSFVPSENANTLPPLSLHLSKKRSRRANATGPISDRGRERIKELEQRIRELESSAVETTARATIKVLQTRVRDLEAEVDCLTMRLESAELAMSRTRSEGRKSTVSQNLFAPLLAAGVPIPTFGMQDAYVPSLPAQACDIAMSTSSDPSMAMSASNESAIPRSVNAAVRPLINWDTSPVSANQRPVSAIAQHPMLPGQQTAIWRGAY